mmetsp:Transcript_52203/g.146858  ORF Transcript_52203/g.146858 Transcript_52203/m.146858 type:complete len:277 (-) Transcript_52203:75-905(-)
MFDFDEIETDVKAKGVDAWKEGADGKSASPEKPPAPPAAEKPKAAAGGGMFDFDEIETEAKKPAKEPARGGGGMFDFDEIETDAQKKTGASGGPGAQPAAKAQATVRVGFRHMEQRWSQEYKVDEGASISDLKRAMAPPEGGGGAAQFQLLRAGRPAADSDPVVARERLDFAYLPPYDLLERRGKPYTASGAAVGSSGDVDVTVLYHESLNLSTVFKVKSGSTVASLKAQMATQDPSGQTRADDFDLLVAGGPGHPLGGGTPLGAAELGRLVVCAA